MGVRTDGCGAHLHKRKGGTEGLPSGMNVNEISARDEKEHTPSLSLHVCVYLSRTVKKTLPPTRYSATEKERATGAVGPALPRKNPAAPDISSSREVEAGCHGVRDVPQKITTWYAVWSTVKIPRSPVSNVGRFHL